MNWLSIRTPLTPTDIMNVEKDFSISLPADYKFQIASINGGALRSTYIRLPKLGEVSYSRNVSLHKEAQAGIYKLIGIFNDGPVKLFPFASVGNGDYFCFDLTTNTVVLHLHEIDKTIYVCDSFSQLLSMLVTE